MAGWGVCEGADGLVGWVGAGKRMRWWVGRWDGVVTFEPLAGRGYWPGADGGAGEYEEAALRWIIEWVG